MKTETPTQCRKCGEPVDIYTVFPGGICLDCHAAKFDREAKRNGGVLPRPDFTSPKLINLEGAK